MWTRIVRNRSGPSPLEDRHQMTTGSSWDLVSILRSGTTNGGPAAGVGFRARSADSAELYRVGIVGSPRLPPSGSGASRSDFPVGGVAAAPAGVVSLAVFGVVDDESGYTVSVALVGTVVSPVGRFLSLPVLVRIVMIAALVAGPELDLVNTADPFRSHSRSCLGLDGYLSFS